MSVPLPDLTLTAAVLLGALLYQQQPQGFQFNGVLLPTVMHSTKLVALMDELNVAPMPGKGKTVSVYVPAAQRIILKDDADIDDCKTISRLGHEGFHHVQNVKQLCEGQACEPAAYEFQHALLKECEQ